MRPPASARAFRRRPSKRDLDRFAGVTDQCRADGSRGGVRGSLGRLGPLLQDAQVRLHPAGQRGPTKAHEDARPSIERFECGGVDDPRPAGDRLETPAPLAVEAGRRDPHPEARIRAGPRGSRPGPRRAAGRAGRVPSASSRRPARPARPDRAGARERGRPSRPGRGASPRPCAAWRARRRAARRRRRPRVRRPRARPPSAPPPVPTAILSRRSGARPSSSRGRRRSIRGVRWRRRRASRSGPRRPSSGGAAGA